MTIRSEGFVRKKLRAVFSLAVFLRLLALKLRTLILIGGDDVLKVCSLLVVFMLLEVNGQNLINIGEAC